MRLQQRLQLFQTDPRIERINAELRPGETRGESVLNVRVAERRPIKAWLNTTTSRHRAVGSNRVMGTIVDESLLGFGDRVSVSTVNRLASIVMRMAAGSIRT